MGVTKTIPSVNFLVFSLNNSQYKYQDSQLLASLMQLYIRFLPGWSGAEIKCTVNVSLPKRPINYHKRAIITSALHMFYPIFEVHFFVFKEVFSENSVLMNGQCSRVVCNHERVMMERVQQFKLDQQNRQQALRAYCPNIYILCFSLNNCKSSMITLGWVECMDLMRKQFCKGHLI